MQTELPAYSGFAALWAQFFPCRPGLPYSRLNSLIDSLLGNSALGVTLMRLPVHRGPSIRPLGLSKWELSAREYYLIAREELGLSHKNAVKWAAYQADLDNPEFKKVNHV